MVSYMKKLAIVKSNSSQLWKIDDARRKCNLHFSNQQGLISKRLSPRKGGVLNVTLNFHASLSGRLSHSFQSHYLTQSCNFLPFLISNLVTLQLAFIAIHHFFQRPQSTLNKKARKLQGVRKLQKFLLFSGHLLKEADFFVPFR